MRGGKLLPKGSAEYQKLLDLLNEAVSGGDLSGGSAFDKTTLLKLEEQAQSFASLPTGTAGVRVMDDSFNYPLSLLLARLLAMRGEADNFTTVSGRLLDILAHETRSLPRREHNIPARAGEDRSRLLPSQASSNLSASTYICRPSGRRGYRSKRVPGREAGRVGRCPKTRQIEVAESAGQNHMLEVGEHHIPYLAL